MTGRRGRRRPTRGGWAIGAATVAALVVTAVAGVGRGAPSDEVHDAQRDGAGLLGVSKVLVIMEENETHDGVIDARARIRHPGPVPRHARDHDVPRHRPGGGRLDPRAHAGHPVRPGLPVRTTGRDHRVDEGTKKDNHIPFIVVAPHTSKVVVDKPATLCSVLATMSEVLAVKPLGCAADAESMAAEFGLVGPLPSLDEVVDG